MWCSCTSSMGAFRNDSCHDSLECMSECKNKTYHRYFNGKQLCMIQFLNLKICETVLTYMESSSNAGVEWVFVSRSMNWRKSELLSYPTLVPTELHLASLNSTWVHFLPRLAFLGTRYRIFVSGPFSENRASASHFSGILPGARRRRPLCDSHFFPCTRRCDFERDIPSQNCTRCCWLQSC